MDCCTKSPLKLKLSELEKQYGKYETHILCDALDVDRGTFLNHIKRNKHVPEHIGILTEELYQKCLWKHQPLTDFWNIGRGTAARLAKYGVFDMKGITKLPEELLYKEFGIKAEFLIDHAWGRESCTMADIHNYKGKSRSLSNSQILFEDYNVDSAHIVMKEMVETLVLELVENNL